MMEVKWHQNNGKNSSQSAEQRGDRLIFQENLVFIAYTVPYSTSLKDKSIHGYYWMHTINIKLTIYSANTVEKALFSQQEQKLVLIAAQIKTHYDLRKMNKIIKLISCYFSNILYDYVVKVNYRFNRLDLINKCLQNCRLKFMISKPFLLPKDKYIIKHFFQCCQLEGAKVGQHKHISRDLYWHHAFLYFLPWQSCINRQLSSIIHIYLNDLVLFNIYKKVTQIFFSSTGSHC